MPMTLFVGGPRDGHREDCGGRPYMEFAVPSSAAAHWTSDPLSAEKSYERITYRLHVFGRRDDAVEVYAIQWMTPQDVLLALITRYPMPVPTKR